MAPENDSGSDHPDQEDGPEIPPDLGIESHPNPQREKFRNNGDRPRLIRRDYAGHDSPIGIDTVKGQRALRYFDLTLVPESDLFEDWEKRDDRKKRMVRAAVLQEFFDDSYEELEERLKSSSAVATEAGFDSGDVPSDTTLWRGIRGLDEELVKEAARRADNAVLHSTLPGGRPLYTVGVSPRKPNFYYEITNNEREISIDRKMEVVTQAVADYMTLAIHHISFGRDKDAPNYQHPPEAFYRLLAHLALEDCYAEKGSDLFGWLSDDDVAAPDSSTLHDYARKYDVDEHAVRFLNATCLFLKEGGLLPAEPIHLGFDITKQPWYGNVKTDDEDEVAEEEWRIKSAVKDNTTWFWPIAVLSIVTPNKNYVLGFQPVDAEDEYDDTLDTMLERVDERFNLDFGRIYLDSGLGNTKIIDVCEDHNLKWLIQGEITGEREKLVEKLPPNTPGGKRGVKFGSDDPREINIFACPDPKETIKSRGATIENDETERKTLEDFISAESDGGSTDGSDSENNNSKDAGNYIKSNSIKVRDELEIEGNGSWSVWNTNMDIKERDLRGLAYQYRNRWRVETAIRQLKHDFMGRCGSDSPRVRALYQGAGQLFFNFWVALNHELPRRLDHIGVRVTALELLHGLREADFEEGSLPPWI